MLAGERQLAQEQQQNNSSSGAPRRAERGARQRATLALPTRAAPDLRDTGVAAHGQLGWGGAPHTWQQSRQPDQASSSSSSSSSTCRKRVSSPMESLAGNTTWRPLAGALVGTATEVGQAVARA